jgi:hypothetical protein
VVHTDEPALPLRQLPTVADDHTGDRLLPPSGPDGAPDAPGGDPPILEDPAVRHAVRDEAVFCLHAASMEVTRRPTRPRPQERGSAESLECRNRH